jgi:hypothetical protein
MNPWLDTYLTNVRFPEVSGAEHLELLQARDQLANSDPTLTAEEQNALYDADQSLITHAAAFYTEIARFVDLATYRTEHHIDPTHWWWYLDVIQELPLQGTLPTTQPSPR